MDDYKKLSYGVSNYETLVEKNRYFVDKTPYIKEMEDIPFLTILRPRRFGKSLFLSMLSCYYDINKRNEFEKLFKGTWIADNPTEELGEYQVLTLDFSRIGNASAKDVPDALNTYCCDCINEFMERYRESYPEHIFQNIVECDSCVTKFNRLHNFASRTRIPLCLLVDEYDNFTNTILASEGHEVYHAITHADGFYRKVFMLFKGMFSRIVLTGVSPVTFNDLTSGFNISMDVTMFPEYNAALGFSTEEVEQMLRYYQKNDLLPADTTSIMKEMKEWYDGYCFSEDSVDSKQRIFNSTMVINYLHYYIHHRRAPKNLVDKNTRTDYAKLQQLLKLDHLNGNRKDMLLQIVQYGTTVGNIVDSFSAEEITKPSIFKSLLFYYGMLSFTKDEHGGIALGIPNKNVRRLFYNYLTEEYEKILPLKTAELEVCFKEAAIDGKWKELIELLCQRLHASSSIRCLIEGERNAQGYLLACMHLTPFYLTTPEVEVNHGYCDFFLMPDFTAYPTIAHSYIIELKYLNTSDTEAQAEAQWQQAVEQIGKYVQAPKVRLLSNGTQLHGLILQIKGSELYRTEEIICLDFTK